MGFDGVGCFVVGLSCCALGRDGKETAAPDQDTFGKERGTRERGPYLPIERSFSPEDTTVVGLLVSLDANRSLDSVLEALEGVFSVDGIGLFEPAGAGLTRVDAYLPVLEPVAVAGPADSSPALARTKASAPPSKI